MKPEKALSRAFFLILFLFAFVSPSWAADTHNYDVVIIGAGSGGSAAAIQAARMGVSVALVERSDWVGGQMTGAAVSTMDDKTMTRTGIYDEFITLVRDYYASIGRSVNVCYWGNDTIAFEPEVGRHILLGMFKKAGKIDVWYKAKLLSARVDNNRVTAAVFESEETLVTIRAKVFIDATEYGDFIPLTGARYRSGNSVPPQMNPYSVIQDITYTAVVKKYAEGLPPELWIASPPPKYFDYLFYFRSMIRLDGDMWPGNYPFNVPAHNAYRALPDPANPAEVRGGDSRTWRDISKTVINWANDYPGNDYPHYTKQVKSLPADFLENREFRLNAEREAMLKTLCFIYYMQHELGMRDWSVDNGQGYGEWFSSKWREWGDLVAPYAPILRHFPPFPYVRESRRLIGVRTLTIDDIKRDPALKRTVVNMSDSVALGEYPTDIHGMTNDEYLEADLGETKDKLPNDWQGDGGLFQIPATVLIPEKIDGLLAAEKNISVSRLVNGSTRLQPVTMLTGQAAGALAALAAINGVQPREVSVFDVQAELLKAKTRLSLWVFEDVPEYSSAWPGVEAAMLYGYMAPADDKYFGAFDKTHWIDVRDAFRGALGVKDFPPRDAFESVVESEFTRWLAELYGRDISRYKSVTEKMFDGRNLSKGKLAQIVYEIKIIDEAARSRAKIK